LLRRLTLDSRLAALSAVDLELLRPGFYPAGGGRIRVDVQPVGERGLQPLHLTERGAPVHRRAVAVVADLPDRIGRRELRVIEKKLGLAEDELRIDRVANSQGPGNLLTIELAYEHITEVCTGFGEMGKPAERVAGEAVHGARAYLQSDAPVGRHLADQLLIPLALAGSGSFRALPLSRHTLTNIEVVHRFLPVRVEHSQDGRVAEVRVSGA